MSLVKIPISRTSMKLSIIDSTGKIVGASGCSVKPTIPGQPYLNFASYCFLLEHPSNGRRVLFDAGMRVDWWNLTSENVDFINNEIAGLRVEKSINQILREGGIDDQSIDTIIWSHLHFDHIGDSSLFSSSTEIVVGPGFKEEFMPGFPTDKEAILLDSDFGDRTVREIDFVNDTIEIGGFRAVDFFKDGTLYLLDTPGHAPAHLSALVRTTPDTFVLLGGDMCDAPQILRPSVDQPLPEDIHARLRLPCSNDKTTAAPICRKIQRSVPIGVVSDSDDTFYDDPVTSQRSVDLLQRFDADSRILVALAHDCSLGSVLRFFPEGSINDWHSHGWKERLTWCFLKDLPINGDPPENDVIVDGLYRQGKKLRSLQDTIKDHGSGPGL